MSAKFKMFGSFSRGPNSGESVNPASPTSAARTLKPLAKSGAMATSIAIGDLMASRLNMRKSMPSSKQEWFEKLLTEEDRYCELMGIFKDEYVRPIKDDSKISKPVFFTRDEFKKLVVFLSNVEALYTLNSGFRDDLRTKKVDGLGEVLAQYAPLFQMYGQYSSDIAEAEATIMQQAEANERFGQFLVQKTQSTNHSVADLLRMPLDRIDEYAGSVLTLCELCPDDIALAKACEELNRTADFVQEQKIATQRQERFKQLQKQWTKVTLTNASATRQFIMEGDLCKFNRKTITRYNFLLFTDVLMYGVPIAGDKVRFKRSLPLATMVIEDASGGAVQAKKSSLNVATLDEGLDNADDDVPEQDEDASEMQTTDVKAHAFFILTPEKSFRVAAETAESKAGWIAELNWRIAQARQAHGAQGKELNVDDLKPVWVPDVESKACMRCNRPFTIMRRRHHCRRCGKLVCQPCSRSRMSCTVPAGKEKLKTIRVRVCDDCAVKPPSVRYSLRLEPLDMEQISPDGGLDDELSSDEEMDRRLSMSSASGSAADTANVKFDDASAAPQPGLLCVVIEARPKEKLDNPDEIELSSGDDFQVDEITEGWAVGTNLRTGEYGFAPANFMCIKGTSEEPPFNWDGVSKAPALPEVAPPAPPPNPPYDIQRRRSSGSTSGETGSYRVSLENSPVIGSVEEVSNISRRRSTDEDASRGIHRRTGSNQASDDGKSHRRSGSSQVLDDRRGSSALQPSTAAALLPFTDKRSFVMNEMVVTERTYLNSLNALLIVFVRPLVTDYKSGKPQIGGSVLGVMNEAGDGSAMSVFMSRLEHIVTLNSKLAVDLEARLAQWATAHEDLGGNAAQCTCGDVFVNYAPLFNMYDEYSSSYEFATKTLVDREKTDSKLAKFFEDQSETHSALLKQQTLYSLLITPIQRVPRYLLLLKELHKNTPEGHPDRPLIERAIATISDVALHINEHIRERENTVVLREIDRELGGSEHLTDNPSRVFLHRGDLVKRSRKADADYHMWLFSDILLYQKKAIVAVYGKPKPPKRIEVKTLSVQDVPDIEGGEQFAFDLRSQSKSFRVFARDTQDKERWLRSLQEAIEQATGGKSLNSKEVAPVWEQNTSACMVCEAHFTFLFRRHHCRACGRCVCDKCSKNRMLIANVDDTKEVRVCQPCFDSLSGPQNSVTKRAALTSAITSGARRGSSQSGTATAASSFKISSALGMSGTKRTQAEAIGLSPRMAAAHAAIVDHKQISAISKEMAERRKQRSSEEMNRSASEKCSSPDRPMLPLRSNSERPGKESRGEKVAVGSPFEHAQNLPPEVPAYSPGKLQEKVPEREAMSKVLQQIRCEVPLEAPKAYTRHELPTPLPVARMASPARLSPVHAPQVRQPVGGAIAASFTKDDRNDRSQAPLETSETSSPAPPAPKKRPAPALPARRPSATAAKPMTPGQASASEKQVSSPSNQKEVNGHETKKPEPPAAPAIPKRRPSSVRSSDSERLPRHDSQMSTATQDTEFDIL